MGEGFRYPLAIVVPTEHFDTFESSLLVLQRHNMVRDWKVTSRNEKTETVVDVVPDRISWYIWLIEDLISTTLISDDLTAILSIKALVDTIKKGARMVAKYIVKPGALEIHMERITNGCCVLYAFNLAMIQHYMLVTNIADITKVVGKIEPTLLTVAGLISITQVQASKYDPEILLGIEALSSMTTLAVRVAEVINKEIEPPGGRVEPHIFPCEMLEQRGFKKVFETYTKFVAVNLARWIRMRLAMSAEICTDPTRPIYYIYADPKELEEKVKMLVEIFSACLEAISGKKYPLWT